MSVTSRQLGCLLAWAQAELKDEGAFALVGATALERGRVLGNV